MLKMRIVDHAVVAVFVFVAVAAATTVSAAPNRHRARAAGVAAGSSATDYLSSVARPLRAGDALDEATVSSLNAFAARAGATEIDWAQARQLVNEVWAVSAGGELCIRVAVGDRDVASCGGSDTFADGRGPFVTGQSEGADPITFGLVPDGVTTVTAELSDGDAVTVPVVNNVYEITSAATATRLMYDSPEGSVQQPVPLTAVP